MKYLTLDGDRSELRRAWSAYEDYIESIKAKLPHELYEFALSPWHHNHLDHRCLHDSWVEKVSIDEIGVGERRQERSLEISVSLLGAYHDGYTYLSYEEVVDYRLQKGKLSNQYRQAHGDWLIDEIRLSDEGNVIHEILFSNEATWIIECKNIKHSTDISAGAG